MPEPLTGGLMLDLLRQLHIAFPRNIGMQNPQLMADTYRNGLRGLSGEAIRWSVGQVIQDDKYFPKVSRLRELASGWNRANRVEIEAAIQRPSGWCDGCQTVAKPETRWRPRVTEKGKRIWDERGRLALEQFQRMRCRCDAGAKYFPDGELDDYMTFDVPLAFRETAVPRPPVEASR